MSSRRNDREQPSQTFSLDRPNTFTKIDLTPRRHHFFNVLLFIFGTFLPPLAVAARFGIGTDFWLNVFFTICGYIPGHGHNFYIQNIRNNKNHRRTPKWALRYGLVDDSDIRRRERRSRWAGKYNDRLPQSTLEGREVEDGQIPDRPAESAGSSSNDVANDRLWNNNEENYYGQRKQGSNSDSTGSSGGGRWRYPANFDDAVIDDQDSPTSSKKKKRGFIGGGKKKDRWALSEDARRGAPVPDGEYVGEPAKKKKKTKRRKKGGDGVGNDGDPYNGGYPRTASSSTVEEPEDAVGGLYGNRRTAAERHEDPQERRTQEERELFEHQF